MELRLLMIVARVLDPRAWRRRLVQVGGFFASAVLIWVCAVRSVDRVRRRRDARHAARDAAIMTRQRASERRSIDESIDSLV